MSEADRFLNAARAVTQLERKEAAARWWPELAEREARRYVRGDLTAVEFLDEMQRYADKLTRWVETGEVSDGD